MEIAITVVLAGAIALNFLVIRGLLAQIQREQTAFGEERQILLNRIQNPQYVVPMRTEKPNTEELERIREENEQFGLVGKIID